MGDVPCRSTAALLDALRRTGIDPRDVVRGTGLPAELLQDASTPLSWDDYLDLVEAVEKRGGPQIWDPIACAANELSLNRPLRTLAGVLWTEEQFWRLIVSQMAPRMYPGVDFACESLSQRRFRLSVRIPPGRRGSEAFVRLLAGMVRNGPSFLGGSQQAEMEEEISPHLGKLTVRPSFSPGLLERSLRWTGGFLLGGPAVAELERRQRATEQTAAQLQARNRSLSTLEAVADTINEPLDFAQTAQRIVDALVEHTDAPGVCLYTASEDGSQLELSGRRGPGDERLPEVLPASNDLASRSVLGQRVLTVSTEAFDDLTPRVRQELERNGMQAAAVVPLLLHDRIVGALGFAFHEAHSFDPEEEAWLLALGKTAAAALMNARHVTRIRREVEERERATQELRHSEERLREITENVHGIFYLMDASTRQLLYLSPSFESVTGLPARSILEDPQAYFEMIHPDDRARVAELTGPERAPTAYEVEYRVLRPDGSIRHILERTSLVHSTDGNPVRIAGFAQDVTAMRELELQLRHSQKMEAVGRLAGGIAHDFNNYLTVISSYAEILCDRFGTGDENREPAEEILRAAQRASGLTRGLLALVRRQPVRVRTHDLGVVVRELSGMLRSLLGENMTLALEIEAGELPVSMDRGQLEQVLVNLAVNARDAMPAGGTLTLAARTLASGVLQLSARDQGVGMDPAVAERVFEPFFSTKDPSRSTGLGLATVHGIVEQAGGRIRMESTPGKGSLFEIELPRSDRSPQARSAAPAVHARGHETLLVVEDQDEVRAVAARALRERGYRVIEASDAKQALELASRSGVSFDLLVTDVVMPGMSGTELAALLSQKREGLPVLFVSGYTGDEEDREAKLAAGAFLAKPFTPDALASAVREALEAKAY